MFVNLYIILLFAIFYNLPNEIITKIYTYDSTFRDIYKEFIALVESEETAMEEVVDEVVNNFFNNNIFYAKRI